MLNFDDDKISIAEYTHVDLNVYNSNYAIYEIESYFVLYSSKTTSKYSIGVCDIYDNTHFIPKQHYTIENVISFEYNGNTTERQQNVTLLANSPPTNGTCNLVSLSYNPTNQTQKLGVIDYNGIKLQLFNQYEVFCDGWFDQENNTSSLQYNFIYDSVVFLNAFYSKSPNTTIIVGSGKHTIEAVVSDEHSLPVCFSMDVIAPATIFDNITRNITFSEIMDIYRKLLASGATNTGDRDSHSHTVTDQSIVTNLLYDGIVGTISNATQNSEFAELQTNLIEVFLDTVNEPMDAASGTAHANVLSVVSKTTTPVIPSSESEIIYNSNVSLTVLTSMNDKIVPNLGTQDNVDSYSATQIVQTFDNTLTIRECSNESFNKSKTNGQLTLDTVKDAAQFLTSLYIPSETITIVTETIVMEASKIATDMDYNEYCSLNGSVVLSNEYIVQQSFNGTQFMDCIVMNTQTNVYFVSNDVTSVYVENLIEIGHIDDDTTVENVFQSDFILLEVIAENTTFTTSTTMSETNTFLSECEPILLFFNPINISFFNISSYLPQCSFYNTTTQTFDENGCFLLSYDDGHFTCSCYHAAYFSVTWDNFTPDIDFLSEEAWKSLTFNSVINDSFGLIIVVSWMSFCIFIIIMIGAHHKTHMLCQLYDNCANITDKPLVAQTDVVEMALTYNNEINYQIENYISLYRGIQESRIIEDVDWTNLSFCDKFQKAFVLSVKNDHLWLGICFRSYGTNYTYTQRLLMIMFRLLISMATAACFFGRAKDRSVGDLSLSCALLLMCAILGVIYNTIFAI